MRLHGIVKEDYGDNDLHYFTEQWLTSVEFRKRDDYIEVLLCNDGILSSLPDGIDITDLDDESFEAIEWIIEEFTNHGSIVCHKVEMK